MKAIGYQQLTVTDAVAALTVPDGALNAFCKLEADATSADKAKAARFRMDGPNPTASVGHLSGDGDSWTLRGNLDVFRAIGIEAGKTHRITVTYFG